MCFSLNKENSREVIKEKCLIESGIREVSGIISSCSPSASRFDVLYILILFLTHHGYRVPVSLNQSSYSLIFLIMEVFLPTELSLTGCFVFCV